MRKIQFLLDMKKEAKLELVEPSEDIAEAYLEKSDSHFDSAKILIKFNRLEESVSLAYYGMYHCLLALLFKCGIKSENHAVSILLLKELFKEEELAKEISFGKKERVDKQYYIDFNLTKLDAEDMLKKSENFIIKCKLLIKNVDNDRMHELRQELKEVIS